MVLVDLGDRWAYKQITLNQWINHYKDLTRILDNVLGNKGDDFVKAAREKLDRMVSEKNKKKAKAALLKIRGALNSKDSKALNIGQAALRRAFKAEVHALNQRVWRLRRVKSILKLCSF